MMIAEDEKNRSIQRLQAENALLKSNNDNGTNATKILSDMLQLGDLYQDEDGEIQVNEEKVSSKMRASESQSEHFII